MKNIYLDNAAAAPIELKVQKEVGRGMRICGNPSSFNNSGRQAANELAKARLKVARFLGAHSDEVIFTASGSEANNLAITGAAVGSHKKRNVIITTPIEHPSVLEPIKVLKSWGFKVNFVKVDQDGLVDVQDIVSKLNRNILLVSVMYANNEIGTVEPITKIGKMIKEFRNKPEIRNLKLGIHETTHPLFHVDACQAAGYLDINVNSLGADLVTINGSKIGGPRGIGILYVRRGTNLAPLVLGGGQERGLRAGTENLPAILGLVKAIELIDIKEGIRLASLRDYFVDKLRQILPEVKINGPVKKSRLPNNINISIPNLDSENLLLELDKYGISASSGSACTSHLIEASHVLKAIGVDKKYLLGALRFSMGRQTTKSDIDYLLKVLPKIVKDLEKRYRK